jgi:hypothetical protein
VPVVDNDDPDVIVDLYKAPVVRSAATKYLTVGVAEQAIKYVWPTVAGRPLRVVVPPPLNLQVELPVNT